MEKAPFDVYVITGEKLKERDLKLAPPEFLDPKREAEKEEDRPDTYRPTPDLANAVNVALRLGMPLLIAGAPGTGKTTLADSIAAQLGLGKVLRFVAKTTSVATDVLYEYDAIGHFQSRQIQGEATKAEEFLSYRALGKAIVLATKPAKRPKGFEYESAVAERRVVLIDEIDKAPRDFPNDLLDEIEHMRFRVKQTGENFEADPDHWPIVILTSNEEKPLPRPFLRRCVYHHLERPGPAVLFEILKSRGIDTVLASCAIEHLEKLNDASRLETWPSTSQLLQWVHFLRTRDIGPDAFKEPAKGLEATYVALGRGVLKT